jgi:dihydrofolate reductase
MRKLLSFMHISLDGFVAGPNGEMDWINVDETIFDYASARTNEADTALYGRVRYQMMEGYWPTAAQQPGATKHDIEHSRSYNAVDKVVMSRSMKGKSPKQTTIIRDNLNEKINALKNQKGMNIIMFGSPGASHALMKDNLIDGYWLFVNPVLLGKEVPLFANIKQITKLNLISTHTFPSGVVCLYYEK